MMTSQVGNQRERFNQGVQHAITTASAAARRAAARAAAWRKSDGCRSAPARRAAATASTGRRARSTCRSTISAAVMMKPSRSAASHVEQQQRRRQQGAQAVELAGRRRGCAALDRNRALLPLRRCGRCRTRSRARTAPARPDHEREHVGADRLAGHRRQQPAAIGGSRAEANEKQSRDAIGKTHGRAPTDSSERMCSRRGRIRPWRDRRPSSPRPSGRRPCP